MPTNNRDWEVLHTAIGEEGQGESSGLSSLERALSAIAEAMPEQSYIRDMGIWRDIATVSNPYWGVSYGLQPITEMPMGTGTSNFPFHSDFGRTSERGEQMRFSGQPDPLTRDDKDKLEIFYTKFLKDGFASWPLEGNKVMIFIDGHPRKIYPDFKWGIESERLYIGYARDEGGGPLSNPSARLACVTALMGITGHANKPELIALLSERLAKVMVGVYDTVVKPLASTLDSRPVRRMAWSADGGLATWMDGAWVGLTGEPVAVGPDWIVIDTNEGPIEDGAPAVGAVGAAPIPAQALTHAQWVEIKERFDWYVNRGWRSHTMADGRIAVGFISKESCECKIRDSELFGCLVVTSSSRDGEWAITYPPEPPLDEPAF